MTIKYEFSDVDAHGTTISAEAMPLEAEHQAILRGVAAGDFWGGAGSTACQQFVTELGRDVLPGDLRAGKRPGLHGANGRCQDGQHPQRRRHLLGLTRWVMG